MSSMLRMRPSASMNAIDSGMYVFFIQNAERLGPLEHEQHAVIRLQAEAVHEAGGSIAAGVDGDFGRRSCGR